MKEINNQDLFNKYMHQKAHINKLEIKQFNVEEHLKRHPRDYVSVISNQKIKSELMRCEYKLKQTMKLMEIGADLYPWK